MSLADTVDKNLVQKSKVILEVDAFPFKGLNISEEWKKLEFVEGRTVCSSCGKSRKYFCYTCYISVPEVIHFVPKVKLPIKVDVIKHAREMDGKSTAVHAAVLAPDDVKIYTYPCIPDYDSNENVILIYPNPNAVSVEEISERFFKKAHGEPTSKRHCTESSRFVIDRAVFIDSTWNQSRGIYKDSRIKSLPSVVLKSRLSQFWRHQAGSPRWYLATVEAIHQFFVEVDKVQWVLNQRTALGSDDKEKPCVASVSDVTEEACDVAIASDAECALPSNKDSNTNSSCQKVESGSLPSDIIEKCLDYKNNIIDSLPKEKLSNRQDYCYRNQYDNLLFFFRFMYSKIHTLYDHDNLKSYKRRLE